ncbi:hypothetical protein Trco_003110 [Trichoderma cornu-damae]|uniref:Uncharacterized protein n=1 Tax=Trichoderma cornu-damae TaxID=654480 RepID=A0A9P8QR60_9HYPO|nr:hypothetical protein Trco_003110 [Trichoderma cornu-damae]
MRPENGSAVDVDIVQVLEAVPNTDRQPRGDGGAERRGLAHSRTHAHKTYLHNQIRVAHAAVHGELGQRLSAVLLHGAQDGLRLEACGLERGAGDVAALGVRGDAEDGAPGVVDPVGREQAAEGGDEGAAAVVLDLLGEGAELGRRVDEAEVVDQELDAGPGDGDAAFEGVHPPALAKVERDRGQEAVGGDDGLGADVVEQEAAGAVGVLGEAGREPLLAHQGGRLVAQAPGDLDAPEGGGGQGAVGLGVRGAHDPGQRDLGAVDAEPVNELRVVVERLEVHEHGPRGVGGIRHVDVAGGAAVELVGQPRVDGAEGEGAALVRLLDLVHVLEEPQQLADGRVRGEGEAAPAGQLAGPDAVLELADQLLGAGVGPDDGPVQGLAGGLVPNDGGLALVGDADGDDLLARVALLLEFLDGAVHASLYGGDELLGVVLMPAGLSFGLESFRKYE